MVGITACGLGNWPKLQTRFLSNIEQLERFGSGTLSAHVMFSEDLKNAIYRNIMGSGHLVLTVLPFVKYLGNL